MDQNNNNFNQMNQGGFQNNNNNQFYNLNINSQPFPHSEGNIPEYERKKVLSSYRGKDLINTKDKPEQNTVMIKNLPHGISL
eukprot:CAMPEP_0114592530 /NCGR_PEP_ID=MMETSP0125-20121206/14336_1 /TAXON_ID=485358 ORGANISM="Aristerostoma sp., Strain ATCC 50986" /NCGR_SAMPLE_ID=MMETSP0125 /ASSEMBLY_ACC=CAM_ASM_000245 /LENGTH=81 /DNA_ID=CAMNT_0001791225 /DNA_START=214 /DNA_END=459 /DNA_ORIENTATION=+